MENVGDISPEWRVQIPTNQPLLTAGLPLLTDYKQLLGYVGARGNWVIVIVIIVYGYTGYLFLMGAGGYFHIFVLLVL